MTESSSADPLLSEVAALPRHDVEPATANRIRVAALRHFDPVAPAPSLWTRVFEPAIVVVSVLGYLVWTAQTLAALQAAARESSVITAGRSE